MGALALAALLAAFLFTAGCGPSQVRPELVLKVNGQEVARLPQADCGKADWSFPNVPTNVGDAIQVVAVDAQGNPLWTQDFGTLPALPDYLKDIMRQLSPETTEIADFLDAGGYPIEFVPAQELVPDAIAAWDPINKSLELHVDLQNAPLAVLIAALTHEGTHARQPLVLDIHRPGGEERAEAIRQPVEEMLGKLDAGEITVEAFDQCMVNTRHLIKNSLTSNLGCLSGKSNSLPGRQH